MSVICQCPSCKAKYQVGDKYAGRTIKCRKCSSAVGVPAVARAARPAVVASDHPPSGGYSQGLLQRFPRRSNCRRPASCGRRRSAGRAAQDRRREDPLCRRERQEAKALGDAIRRCHPRHLRNVGRKRSPRRPSSAAADAVVAWTAAADQDKTLSRHSTTGCSVCRRTGGPAGRGAARAAPPPPLDLSAAIADEPAARRSGDAISVPGLAARSAHGDRAYHPKKKKGLPNWWMPAIAAVGVLAVGIVLVVSVIVLARQRKPESESTTAPPVATAATKGKTGPKVPVLTIDWPENQRAGASLFVNDEKREIPLRGPIEIPLPAVQGAV